MLAKSRGCFHVIFVERDDAVDLPRAREMRHGRHNVSERNLCRQVEGVIQAFPRPIRIAQLLRGEQKYTAALTLALAHELLSLLVGRNAQEGQRARFRHGDSFRNRGERVTQQRRPVYHLFQSVEDWVIFSGRPENTGFMRRWRLLMATQTRPEGKARSFGENIESDLASRFLRVVEVAAIASARTMGQGERKLSDQVDRKS